MRGYNVPYIECRQCVLNSNDDPFLILNDDGLCNHCVQYKEEERKMVFKGDVGKKKLEETIAMIKADGAGKEYDCVLGISGGVDSTYLALIAKQYGLRPICVHCDNGWNSELAVNNIQSIVSKLDLDLETYVINWDEFRDIQIAYFRAHVIDIEAITDIAFRSVLQNTANKFKVKYFLSGDNVVTESVLPKAWICKDVNNLVNIHKRFGTIKLKTYPIPNKLKLHLTAKVRPTLSLAILNYMHYNKEEVKKCIMKELGWKDYGGKHFESVFTRFYQAYILPQKFGVDKRRAHLSNLICSGQMTREEALKELEEPIYDPEMYNIDRDFFLKKIGMSDAEFDAYIATEPILHEEYGVGQTIYDQYKYLKILRPIINKLK
ncbi:MAG: N-acetyl sugar amidotransferase [Candidatus Kuenenia stuttgartiensis]|nr:N-acetyl sugar amidotransferase [Candidatus Kuenenia stuttgartiensis]